MYRYVPTLVTKSGWFLMRIFRGCCGVSLLEKREEHLVETALNCWAWPPPTHSVAIYTSYSRSKANQKERSLQPVARREKLNLDGVYPLVNRVRVIQPVFGVHRRQNTRVMDLGCQLLTTEK